MTASSSRNGKGLKPLLLAVALSAGLHAGAALAQTAASAPQTIDIPAGNLSQALDRLGEQTGVLITYEPRLVQGLNAPRVSGKLPAAEALRRLLSGSGIQVEAINAKTFILRRAPAANPAPPIRQAQHSASRREAQEQPATQDLEKVTVTGTRIRGGSTPSSVITIDAEDVREEGFTDLGEVIRSIPQNFNGGQNPGAVAGSASLGSIANQNINGGSALNLRGLGPDATLTLLNGRRLSYGSFVQAVDISAIPLEAVERLEIVPDGASAIYGSDAVAGVGNVILKRDFEGITMDAQYGGATEGGMTTRSYGMTAGTTWSSGGIIATYRDSSVDSLYADQRSYTEYMLGPYTTYPKMEQRSGLLSVHQSLGRIAELRLDALQTKREQFMSAGYRSTYIQGISKTKTSLLSPGVDFFLANDWTLSIDGTWGRDRIDNHDITVVRATGDAIRGNEVCYCNESRMYEIGAEGPLFSLRGGEARLAVGVGYRSNQFRNHYYFLSDTIGGDETSRSVYAETNVPLISPDMQVGGARRLELTAAVRSEDYDSFGRVTTPKLGLIYGTNEDFTLRASWGKSFKAPTLFRRFSNRLVYLLPAIATGGADYGPEATVLGTAGGNPDLDAERARTWSASLAFHPQSLPGLEAELTWFDIDYTERVVNPIANSSQALSDPINDEFIVYSPSSTLQAEILATRTFYNVSGGQYDPNNVVAIYFDHAVNASRQRIRGIDLSGSWRFDLGDGGLTIRGSASWLDSSQQTTPAQNAQDLAGTIYNPASFKSRVGAVWDRLGFTASLFASHTGGVTNNWGRVGRSDKTASWTTFDAVLRYATGDRGTAWSDWEFSLSAENILGRDPPFHTIGSIYQLPYDATNYSPIGRFLSTSISKHW